jgi:hypothetical protein
MKFIVKDERTQKCLATEAGDLVHKLLCYYFYDMSELPTQQERSLDGLLHYLLYQLLGSFPNLQRKISNLFTQKVLPRYHGATGNLTSPWSLEYLKDALMEISEQKYVHGKICLFIDGFDECQGDFGKTLDFVLSWLGKMQASGLKVKICIASRYIHNITERLKPSLQQPSLKLHEWTRDDIQKYVQDHLNDAVGRSISLSSKSHRIVGNQLVSNVVGNAEGVFIWVKLVVADLESGLEECQEESQLQSRLKALPSELESLYEHIISEIPIRDLHAVFKYFRLLLRAPGDKCTLTLLQFLIAAQKPEEAITCEVEYYSEADHDQFLPQKLELMKDHLKRRCRNLIQIRSRKYASRRWDPLRRENVTFIHVTLKEFLKKPEVQQRIRDRITSSGMEIVASADTLLMASYLRLLKCQVSHIPHWAAAKTLMLKELRELKDESGSEKSQSPRSLTQKSFFDDHDEGDEAEYEEEIKRRAPDNAITKFFNYAQILETRLRKPQTAYIDELNKVLTKADPDWVSKFYYHKTSHQVHGMDILCLAVCCKLKLYVEQKSTSQLVNKERRPPLLFYAMNPPGWAHESVDLKILKLLLKKKVKLNESWVDNGREQTIWGHTFQHYLRIGTSYPEASWENVLDLLLKYRADPDQKVPLQGETYTTALHLLVDQYGKVSSKDHKQTVERGIERLIKHGADVENKDSSGITAYECAETSGQHVFSIFQKAVGDGLSDKRVATPTMMTRARRSVGIKSQNDSQTGNLPTCTGLNQEISATALEPSSSKTSSKTRSANLLQHNTSQKPQKDQMGSSSPTTVQRKGGHDGVQRRSKRLHSEIELDDAEEMQVEYQ